ncbi:exopolyphosphatase-like protein [Patellaria atrata CBS 101060]|uniref:Exopolyphosphatase-like protein n=1 Tax=Patellaria atrata CBS 101060 TaxID=1346257 RepID=A0A9P4SG58_9PEZI|nr:exopolyphosphatase-like protein [Patellaria atrata CBS 101060]
MSLPQTSLRNFLVTSKALLRDAIVHQKPVTIVIGNESADLDSLTSSLLYAYIRSTAPGNSSLSSGSGSTYIPLTNIFRDDIKIRPEFLALLPHGNLEPQHLITLDDLPDLSKIDLQLPPANTRWILVDHNVLQGKLGSIYSDRIRGVIDHHDDEGKIRIDDEGKEPHIITKSGSCTSLITLYCREAWDGLSQLSKVLGAAHSQGHDIADDSSVTARWDAQLAKLALASILVDTSNLRSQDKVTEHDVQAVQYLESKIMLLSGQDAVSFDRAKFHKEINKARKNLDSLRLQDILRKDYKQWTVGNLNLGISSVVKDLEYLVKKAGQEDPEKPASDVLLPRLKEFAGDRGLQMYAIMTTSTSDTGKFQRQLLLWALTPEASEKARKFVEASGDELDLEAWEGSIQDADSSSEFRKIWRQRKAEHSRKRVAPLLKEAMN